MHFRRLNYPLWKVILFLFLFLIVSLFLSIFIFLWYERRFAFPFELEVSNNLHEKIKKNDFDKFIYVSDIYSDDFSEVCLLPPYGKVSYLLDRDTQDKREHDDNLKTFNAIQKLNPYFNPGLYSRAIPPSEYIYFLIFIKENGEVTAKKMSGHMDFRVLSKMESLGEYHPLFYDLSIFRCSKKNRAVFYILKDRPDLCKPCILFGEKNG